MDQAFVTAEWLHHHMNNENLVIFDCRFDLSDPEAGVKLYTHSHLPKARYLHLEKDLSGRKENHGGRHPLPNLTDFCTTLGSEGVDETKTVIAYDDQDGAMAARLWWMLRYVGHEKVYVLNGGFSKWVEDGYPVTESTHLPVPTNLKPIIQSEMLVSMNDVKNKMNDKGTILVDARDPERYKGNYEPIDAVGGHIPNAVNVFWKDNLNENGIWKDKEVLKEQLSSLEREKELIVYCGSGVTACANIIALHSVGRKAKLYAGSWSDWISYQDNPVSAETTSDE